MCVGLALDGKLLSDQGCYKLDNVTKLGEVASLSQTTYVDCLRFGRSNTCKLVGLQVSE